MPEPVDPPPPPSSPVTRGLGIVSGVVAFGAVGLADGVLAWGRAPPGALAAHLGVLVILQCIAVSLTFGIGLGLAEEIVLESARRVPVLARFGRWCSDGPRQWFARDPDSAAALFAAMLGVAVATGPMYPLTYQVITAFHSKPLAALAVFLMQFGFAAVGVGVVVTLAAPLRWLTHRLGRAASPGVVISVSAALIAAQTARFLVLNWPWFRNLEFGAAALLGALLAGNTAALAGFGHRARRLRRPLSWRVRGGAAAVAVLSFVLSATTFGRRQTVAATIFNHSLLTQRVARALQVSLDFDRDGYSAVFNGGDCNDRNPRINPRARDIPGNGIDENCSGRDSRVEVDEGGGHLVAVPTALQARPPSFVLLSVDAMRPDHMGCYGYRRPTTVNIDRWARGAARFTHAYCVSPRSLRSFSSTWVGRYASMVTWGHDVQFPPLDDANLTLAEELREAGYVTASFNNTSYFSHTAGFFQGFDRVQEEYGFKSEVGPTIDRIMAFLNERDGDPQPFFLWTHLMEPHDPYRDLSTPREFGHSAVDQYDEEIARADQSLAPVLTRLQEMARTRPLVVVVFADHGEAFGEHGVYHHSFDLHEEALRVPMLVQGPGITPGPRNALTALFDLNPTLINLAGRQTGAPVSGWSLVPVLYDGRPRTMVFPGWRDHLFAEVTPDGVFPSEQKSLFAPPYKIIYDLRRGTWELFDIARDPGEVTNLFDDRPDVATNLRERLLTWTDHSPLATNRTNELIAGARLAAEPHMQHPMHVRFGDIMELLGYDLPKDQLHINETFRATFYYRVLRRTRRPVLMTVSFDPTDNVPIWPLFIARHHPLEGRYPTTEWNPGEILRDEVSLRVDPEMRPVVLRSFFSIEIESDATRIPPTTQGTPDFRVALAPITILP